MIKPTVYGVGFNDADYLVKPVIYVDGKAQRKYCPYYRKWMQMMNRAYSTKLLETRPTYSDCFACDDWLYFSNFKKWMQSQDWQGKHLDKDILKKNNREYSPEYCVFIDPSVNTFILDCNKNRGVYPLGVYWDIPRKKYKAQCQDPFTRNRGYLGLFDTPLEAHKAWQKRKHELACRLADQQSDPRVADALRKRYAPDTDWLKA